MNKKFFQVLAIATIFGVSTVAMAQQGTLGGRQDGQQGGQRGQRGGGQQGGMQQRGAMQQMQAYQDPLAGSGFATLQRPDVQTDLKVTPEQKTQLDALRQKWAEANRDALTQARQGGQEAMAAARLRVDQQMTTEINRILNKTQQDRFEQIRIQIAGIRALISPKVQSLLNLPSETRTRINVLARNAQQAQTTMMQQVRNQQMTMNDAQAAARAAEEKFDKDLEALLTEADKTKLAEVSGPKFEGRQNAAGRPGAGGAQGGGRPGRGDGGVRPQ